VDQQLWTYLFVGLTFGLYIAIALWARAGSTEDFYVAGHDIHPALNGMATAADWMSAASFLSMAGCGRQILLQSRPCYCRYLCVDGVLHLYCGTDERRWRRDEGDYIYPSRAICCVDFRLYGACDFYLAYRHE